MVVAVEAVLEDVQVAEPLAVPARGQHRAHAPRAQAHAPAVLHDARRVQCGHAQYREEGDEPGGERDGALRCEA